MVNKLFTITNISIYIIIIILCILLLSSTEIFFIKKIIPFLKFYEKNYSSTLIKSIIAINSNKNCPENSSPFKFYTYPGTYKGCLISNKNLEKGSCSLINKLFKKTEEIKETKEKTFNNIFSKKLCAFPFNENNYISNLNQNKNGKNKKFCGLLDTSGNKYFIDEDKECPINKIIINEEQTINEKNRIFTSIELIKNKYYLHYSNHFAENYLITNNSLILSEDYPCINPEEINTFHIQNILSKVNNSYICKTSIDNKRLDTRYIPIINISKNELYKDNDIILDKYINFPFKDIDLTLYQLGYIGIDSLFNNDIISFIDKLTSNINNIYNWDKINKYIKKIIYSLIFIIIVSLICKYFISDSTIYIWNFILLITILLNLILDIIINISIKNLKNIKEYNIENNTDNNDIFKLQIKYIKSIINECKRKNIKNTIGNILLIIFVGIFNFLNYYYFNNPKKYKKNKIDYGDNKKYYNSINVLKPTSFDIKKENLIKFKEEIELPKINNEKNNKENFIEDSNDDEEDNNLTHEKNDNLFNI